MGNISKQICNQSGSVMVVALMIMSLLALMGLSATRSAGIEVRIAANERMFTRNFHIAEGAAMTAAQVVENATSAQLQARSIDGLNADDDTDMSDPVNWDGSRDAVAPIDPNAAFTAVDNGVPRGQSLGLASGTTVHDYSIFGRFADYTGQVMVEIGYRRRFQF